MASITMRTMQILLFTTLFLLNSYCLSVLAAKKTNEIAFLQNIEEGSQAYEAAKKKEQEQADLASRRLNVKDLDKDSLEFIDKIRKIQTYSADFVQNEGTDKNNSRQISGRVKLARPGKFLWTITSPEKERQSYIANGIKSWHYDVGLEQVVVDNFNAKKLAHSPFYILLDDLYNINNNYTVKKIAENTFGLQPKNKTTGDNYITDLKIVFSNTNPNLNTKSVVIKNLSFTAAEQKKILIDLSNSVVNSPMGPNTFNFVPPKGVDIITSDEIM